MGNVYWITGLSGAGKTTIGKLLYEELRKDYANTVFFDGDILRKAFGDDLGYEREDRIKCAMRYARLCDMLERQDINVICCTISMFHCVREWNRENIRNYHEIYIKASMETLQARNQKGLYSAAKANVVGVSIEFEEPKTPNLILQNDGEYTPEEQVEKILSYCRGELECK